MRVLYEWILTTTVITRGMLNQVLIDRSSDRLFGHSD